MSSRPWYKRYPSDFIAGTIGLTAEEKGVYSTILDLLYDRGRAVVDDPQELGRICGCSTLRFKQVRDKLVVLKKIIVTDGRITNSRFEKQHKIEEKEREILSESGKKGAAKTNGSSAAPNKNNNLATETPPPVEPGVQKPESRSQIKNSGGARARAFPPDFIVDEAVLVAASKFGFDASRAASLFDAFRDHHTARGNTMKDWVAAWRTWCRNEVKFSNRNGASNGTKAAGAGGAARPDPVASAAARAFGVGRRDGTAPAPAAAPQSAGGMGASRPRPAGDRKPPVEFDNGFER